MPGRLPGRIAAVRWELRACARKGHVTYAPDEPELKARVHVPTPAGEAWRCLRCGDFVVGEPRGAGPAEDAPIVLRGRALRDATVLRLLAAERFLRGVGLLGIGYAVVRFRSSQATLRELFEADLPAARPLAERLHVDIDGSAFVHLARQALNAKSSTLALVAVLVTAYGAIQVAEGVGLWLLKRWGEYLTVVATAAFVPLEVYEVVEHVTVLRVLALVVNVAAVVYLLLSKRLFGLRGGHAAYQAERHAQSLLEVEEAAVTPPSTRPAAP
ncbi:MAG TPA: DUF2127 domain-containing protein [Mycobacteriales bacterium]|jgi:uncharacterized membrane protein (DUF2068 family)|nr:DUF2127 domain-containing protein [Mycobacteriales bacterium]